MFCFALDNKSSFEYLSRILAQITKIKKTSACNIPVVVVGCKSDAEERTVDATQIEQLTQTNLVPYFESSAKENIAVTECFEWLLRSHLLHVKAVIEKSKRAANKMSLVEICACEAVYPKVVKKKLRGKSISSINVFTVCMNGSRGMYSNVFIVEWKNTLTCCHEKTRRTHAKTSN